MRCWTSLAISSLSFLLAGNGEEGFAALFSESEVVRGVGLVGKPLFVDFVVPCDLALESLCQCLL